MLLLLNLITLMHCANCTNCAQLHNYTIAHCANYTNAIVIIEHNSVFLTRSTCLDPNYITITQTNLLYACLVFI